MNSVPETNQLATAIDALRRIALLGCVVRRFDRRAAAGTEFFCLEEKRKAPDGDGRTTTEAEVLCRSCIAKETLDALEA